MDKFILGWSPQWDQLLTKHPENVFVRISARHKGFYNALTVAGETINCHLSGKTLHESRSAAELPAVGDWCIVGSTFIDESNHLAAVIETLLPRLSKIARMSAGTNGEEQILAANVDYVCIVTSANRDFSINRLRRYILLAQYGSATPVVIVSKVDLYDDGVVFELRNQLSDAFPEVECIKTSSISLLGIEQIGGRLSAGHTGVFVGSSGVGKSTLVNTLLARSVQSTKDVREHDETGRHATSGSEMFFLPNGGIIIDTAGLREVQVVGTEEALNSTIPSVQTFAQSCKFSDCAHSMENGCAVQVALADGQLPAAEYASYLAMQREIAYGRRKFDARAAAAERDRWKKITIANRQRYKDR